MKTSQYLLNTFKETPADAELISHRLMLRAGMIRKLAAGIYTWLPLGYRVLRKVENIVREEMDKAGAQEILMPAVQPAELWQESGRWNDYGPELLRFVDRHQREFCFGPTHEEIVTDFARRDLNSYKQLPMILYQIQTKFRDEVRPRFGVMRAREFMMKDAYSFGIDKASLQQSYDLMYATYTKIFDRLGLEYRAVLADSGSIGGDFSHEFQVLAASGEDVIAYSDKSDYAANIERATSLAQEGKRMQAGDAMQSVDTPTQTSIAAVSDLLNVQPEQTLKTLLVVGSKMPIVALCVRGDHELNIIKAEKLAQVASPLTFVPDQEIKAALKCAPGFIGPVDLSIPVIVDNDAAQLANFVCGANSDGKHLINVNWGRDLAEPKTADLRSVLAGDPSPDGKGSLQLARGIEVGHIFQFDTKYSDPMNASVLDDNGKNVNMLMGSYGIGISRIVAAAIEQNHDDNGIIWPDALAPFHVALVAINLKRSYRVQEACDKLYNELQAAGISVLFDNRNERPGVMFADMDLIGIPHRLVISERGLDTGTIEYKHRRAEQAEHLALEGIVKELTHKLA